ncbi:DNA polymerase interacting tetratricopeptide repeat-containing, protein of 47 kDa [Phymastichus coffea]|uniref:DNA polymerase interacting tetratricopeptide repeat-containing, protein of 47 kDa n=1 Tax=Phymastichus coffea TaxID=108790 RepID=UPI00273BE7A7|nr:DNA polymerase interacting tetratricopeptide repeat-containing, protein of 47 kDa [Phymastichus coffea]
MSEKENNPSEKKVWTEAERLELSAKLDRELEDYIDSLDKKVYTDGWSEDRWQEEMEKHPFFMTKMPENPAEMSPLLEGLQLLKYSEEYNTPNELAQSYKEDGNFNYKHKKYRLAILNFSKGISNKCEDKDLLAQLYNNRALAQFKLQNYRSSLNDCKQALNLKPNYLKAMHTAAKCYYYIKDYDQCISYCDKILNIESSIKELNKEIVTLRTQAVKSNKLKMRDSRLQDIKEKNIDKTKEKIKNIIKARNIKLDYSDIFYDNQHVHLDDRDMLVWPVIFAYPENNQTDFIQNFHESTLISEQLEELFVEPPAWDSDRRYQIKKLHVYFEGINKKPCRIDIDKPLCEILQDEKFIVKNGTPWFYVLVADSREETAFLKSYF